MNNSQVLGTLKRMVSDHEALLHARGVLEAYLQAQETLISLDSLKATKEKEIAELESKKLSVVADQEKDRAQHAKEMSALTQERDALRTEIESLTREVEQIKGSVDEAVAGKQRAISSYDKKIAEQQKTLQALKDEVDALRKKFAA